MGGHRGWPLCVGIGETIQKIQNDVQGYCFKDACTRWPQFVLNRVDQVIWNVDDDIQTYSTLPAEGARAVPKNKSRYEWADPVNKESRTVQCPFFPLHKTSLWPGLLAPRSWTRKEPQVERCGH